MLCVNLQQYSRPCTSVSGGISQLFVFDPSDFNFSQSYTGDAVNQASSYSAVALNANATAAGGAKFYNIKFQFKEAERKWKQTVKGCSVKYEHEVDCTLPQLSNDLTDFLKSLDSAGCCCGLGLIIQHNDGKIFVMGEKFVNGNQIPFFQVQMDGSDGTSGKLFDDENAAHVVFKGDYSRELYEFTGGINAILAFT